MSVRLAKPFDKTTTMETLECEVGSGGAVLRYGEYVIVTHFVFDGYVTAIYEFIETPEETGFSRIECRLNFVEQADEYFKDGGHAVEWALGRIK